jgi:hypothetical protein
MSKFNQIRRFKNGSSESTIEIAVRLKEQLGIKCAAGYLRNKGWSVEGALFVLLGV